MKKVSTYAPAKHIEEAEYIRYLEQLKKDCNFHTNRAKSKLSLMVLGDVMHSLAQTCASYCQDISGLNYLEMKAAGIGSRC